MDKFVIALIPALFAISLFRMVLLPMGFLAKFAVHSLGGFACLWLLNTISGFTGIVFPINAVTILAAGFLGVPGIGLLAMLELL